MSHKIEEDTQNGGAIFRRPLHSKGRLYISRCVCVCGRHLNRFKQMNLCQNLSSIYIIKPLSNSS